MTVGDVIGCLCRQCGVQVYADLQDVLIGGIRTNMEREPDTASDQQADSPLHGDGRVITHIIMGDEREEGGAPPYSLSLSYSSKSKAPNPLPFSCGM